MFTVKSNFIGNRKRGHRPVSFISDGEENYLHSDGSVVRVYEFFETPADAKKVLDKFYPKPKHVWEHGDVFKSHKNDDFMMYINTRDFPEGRQVFYLPNDRGSGICNTKTEEYLKNAKFLFNIKDVIKEKV